MTSQWQTVKGMSGKGGKGVGAKEGKCGVKAGVCYTCHLQGRDWQHNFWECEHHKKFMGWKIQVEKGLTL